MKLKEIAHLRTGDKGNTCNICVVPYDEQDYELIKQSLTPEVVKSYFDEICEGEVKRYEVETLHAFNFVLTNSLNGGVTKSLRMDRHGKSLGMALAEIELG